MATTAKSRNGFTLREVLAATYPPKKKEAPMTRRQKAIAEAFRAGDWGCQHGSVARLLQAAFGVTALNSDEEFYRRGKALVLTDNRNSHDYPLEEVIIVEKDGSNYGLVGPDGSHGNCFPYTSEAAFSTVRLATRKEIERYFAAPSEARMAK